MGQLIRVLITIDVLKIEIAVFMTMVSPLRREALKFQPPRRGVACSPCFVM